LWVISGNLHANISPKIALPCKLLKSYQNGGSMIRRMRKTIVFLFVPFFLAGLAWGEEFCVSNASQLHDALTEAATNGEDDIIRVEKGTYTGNFVYDSFEGKSLTLIGGFAPNCDTQTLDPSNTILDGNDADRVLYIKSHSRCPLYIQPMGW
jgi:hypothetical protein